MVFFDRIEKTKHYMETHEKYFHWSKVVEIIFESSKSMRKKGNRIEIEDDKYYILCQLEKNTLKIINARWRK